MCGRVVLTLKADTLREAFALKALPEWRPRYNLTPGQNLPVIRLDEAGGYRCELLRWGLIPFWAKDEKFGFKTINARAETVAEKPSFRHAFARRRCLIPVSGFFEWPTDERLKEGVRPGPRFITLRNDGEVLVFAGIWEAWTNKATGEVIESCSIITTTPNSLIDTFHDRMPVILGADQWRAWLAPAEQRTEDLQAFLKPCPSEWIKLWPVSTRVNKPVNDDPDLIVPVV